MKLVSENQLAISITHFIPLCDMFRGLFLYSYDGIDGTVCFTERIY